MAISSFPFFFFLRTIKRTRKMKEAHIFMSLRNHRIVSSFLILRAHFSKKMASMIYTRPSNVGISFIYLMCTVTWEEEKTTFKSAAFHLIFGDFWRTYLFESAYLIWPTSRRIIFGRLFAFSSWNDDSRMLAWHVRVTKWWSLGSHIMRIQFRLSGIMPVWKRIQGSLDLIPIWRFRLLPLCIVPWCRMFSFGWWREGRRNFAIFKNESCAVRNFHN